MMFAISPKTAMRPSMLVSSQRAFAKPAKPGGGGGGPPKAETVIPEKRGKTIFEKMIEEGVDFPLGPPAVPNKTWGAPRESMVNKLESHIDLYARKLREVYVRDGSIPTVKSYLNPLRMRQPSDTLQYCMKEETIPGVVSGRDEFGDLDLVWPWNTPYRVNKSEHSYVRPWYLIHPETEEEIRVNCNKIDSDLKTKKPYYIEF